MFEMSPQRWSTMSAKIQYVCMSQEDFDMIASYVKIIDT